MTAAGRGIARRRQRIVEQCGILDKLGREALGRGLAPFVNKLDQLLESARGRVPRRSDRGENRGAMRLEAVAQGGGPKRAQGGKRARDIARERLRRLPVAFADSADRGMGVAVLGGFARRRERAFEIVERRKRDGAKDREFERAGLRFDLAGGAAEPDQRMGKKGKKRTRRKLDRRLEDQPGEHARRALSQRASG